MPTLGLMHRNALLLLSAATVAGCATAGAGPGRAGDAVVVDLAPGRVALVVNGQPQLFAESGCVDGAPKPLESQSLGWVAAAAVARAKGSAVLVRVTTDVRPTTQDALLEQLRVRQATAHVEGTPPRAVTCPEERAAPLKGSLSKAQIGDAIRANLARFKDCFANELKKDPSLTGGRVKVYFTISPTGEVVKSKLRENTVQRQVGACVRTTMDSVRFPAPKGGGIVVVTYPFVFGVN